MPFIINKTGRNKGKILRMYKPDGEKDVYVPEGVLRISVRAFYNNKEIETVHLPDTVLYIEESAFKGCENLREIYGRGVKCVRQNAFLGCKDLKTIEFSSSFNDKILINLTDWFCYLIQNGRNVAIQKHNNTVISLIKEPEPANKPFHHNKANKPIYKVGDIVLLKEHLFQKQAPLPPPTSEIILLYLLVTLRGSQ